MTSPSPELLRIGQVSTQSSLPVKTIRFYEERGLIQAAKRTSGGFRLFEPSVLTRLSFIRQSQALGLSLNDIQDVLGIADSGRRPCKDVRQKFQTKIVEIDERIHQLNQLKQQLQVLVTEADQREMLDADYCPIIEHAAE
ncbi:MerR family DNA-binding protein [Oscillatoria sp. CS-180]|uniref:MerR family DNA-binding protein n=1 Tax=Oscillatoria sp. CS-180 TaxID=3021720 RepID=UPI002330AB57|nr:MerR family DNA-binding protein [Oscillatoria sp. CS-180]MDB9526678.1 MerR family DNA-binding protein [Oscillatoria sp. CS-180]